MDECNNISIDIILPCLYRHWNYREENGDIFMYTSFGGYGLLSDIEKDYDKISRQNVVESDLCEEQSQA